MYKRILVAVDGSETSRKGLVAAVQLARESGGRVHVVHVFDILVYMTGFEYGLDGFRQAQASARNTVEDAVSLAKIGGVEADGKLLDVPGRRLGDVVADEARAFDADLVVVGTHGRHGVSRALLGSGAEQIVRLSPLPVLVVRGNDAD